MNKTVDTRLGSQMLWTSCDRVGVDVPESRLHWVLLHPQLTEEIEGNDVGGGKTYMKWQNQYLGHLDIS